MRVGLFTDSLEHLSLEELLDWLGRELPFLHDLEVGTGGYSPTPHCDLERLTADADARRAWRSTIEERGFRIAALNVSGNPLEHEEHARELELTIGLAGDIGVGRVVCMSGGRASLAGGGWFPGIEDERAAYRSSVLAPFWRRVGRLGQERRVRLCFELEPGAAVYNTSTFEELAGASPSLAVNLDPSHLFWQSIDPIALVARFGARIGFAHAKDTVVDDERVRLDGRLDRRSWRFATVGDGHDQAWWRSFLEALARTGYDDVVSIEYEDPTRPPEESVRAAAHVLRSIVQHGEEPG